MILKNPNKQILNKQQLGGLFTNTEISWCPQKKTKITGTKEQRTDHGNYDPQ